MSTWKGTREYGDVGYDEKSREIVLNGAEGVWFSHITAGWRAAGSCMTWTDEEYGVFFVLGGSITGRRFNAGHFTIAQRHYRTLVSKRADEREAKATRHANDERRKWIETAHTAIAAIAARLKQERSERQVAGKSQMFPCGGMIDDLDALLERYAELNNS